MASNEFATSDALPDSTTAAAPAEDAHLAMSPPSPPSCAHSIPTSLIPHLPIYTCPSCIIARHISDIKDIQNVLRKRGGVFFSRGRPKTEKHRALMDRWRKAKVALLNLVSTLETSISEHPTEDWKDVNEVLDQWEKEKEVLAKVPGYVYEGEQVKLSDEVSSLVDGMLGGLRHSILGLLLEDGPEVVVAQQGEQPEAEIAKSSIAAAPSSTSISIAIPEQESISELSLAKAASRPRARSILKRKYDHETPTAQKRVRTADFATVSSEQLTISNPSPFIMLSSTPTVQSHSQSTFASTRRRKSHFSRSSESYYPGAWASPAFSTKPNTSCFKLEWDQVEELWKEEEEEVAEEKRVHERLRVIAECHLMCWWVRSVASHVGLERVVKIGQAAAENTESASEGSDGVA